MSEATERHGDDWRTAVTTNRGPGDVTGPTLADGVTRDRPTA